MRMHTELISILQVDPIVATYVLYSVDFRGVDAAMDFVYEPNDEGLKSHPYVAFQIPSENTAYLDAEAKTKCFICGASSDQHSPEEASNGLERDNDHNDEIFDALLLRQQTGAQPTEQKVGSSNLRSDLAASIKVKVAE